MTRAGSAIPGTQAKPTRPAYSTGEIETFPNDGFLAIEIIDDIA
jgi:hypothetical protein